MYDPAVNNLFQILCFEGLRSQTFLELLSDSLSVHPTVTSCYFPVLFPILAYKSPVRLVFQNCTMAAPSSILFCKVVVAR